MTSHSLVIASRLIPILTRTLPALLIALTGSLTLPTLTLTATVVMSSPAHAAGGNCKWEGGLGAPTYPGCFEEDCAEDGGSAICTKPEPRPTSGYNDSQVDGGKFIYPICDVTAPSISRSAVWCQAQGGTWVVTGPATQECQGLSSEYPAFNTAKSEGSANSASDTFASLIYAGCGTSPSDGGWGFSDPGNPYCGAGQSYVNGEIVQDAKRRRYSISCPDQPPGIMDVYISKLRTMACADGMGSRTRSNGTLECVVVVGCSTKGNPVNIANGAKMSRELDYQSADGLSIARYYNSMGRYRPSGGAAVAATPADYWRFSYSRRLIPIIGNANLSAARQDEDGSVKQFDASGHETLNCSQGGADVLQNLGGAGWQLTRASLDVERYDTLGRLTSITTRAGVVTTVSYDGQGRMATISNSFGRSVTLGYNAQNQLITATLPGSSQIQYGYNANAILTTVTYADSTVKTYHYEDTRNSFLLTGITDESNTRFATYTYNNAGQVESEEHAGGVNRHEFTYAATSATGDRSASVIDPLGQNRGYSLARAAGVIKPRSSSSYSSGDANISNATFDANGNYASKWDLKGNQTDYVHDLTRNLETSRTEGVNGPSSVARTITTIWHPTFSLPTQVEVYAGTAAVGTPVRRTTMTYDGAGNLVTNTVTDPATNASRTTTNTVDSFGRVLTMNGPRTDVNDTTTYTFYSCITGVQCGQLQTVTNAKSHVTTYNTYNAHGQVTKITDPNNVATSLDYDARQRLVSQCIGGNLPACTGGELTQMQYWPTGRVKKTINPDGSFLLYSYDGAQRLTQIEDALGNKMAYILDAAGNRQVENAHDPYGALTLTRTQLYNNLGQLWQILTASAAVNEATVMEYDPQGNQTTTAAPLQRNTLNSYDELNRLKQITDPANGVTLLDYNAVDSLAQVTDPRGLVTQYTNNGFAEVTQLTSPDTGITTHSFDSAGNLLTSTNARGAITTNTFDVLNRPLTTTYKIGTTIDQSLVFAYDTGSFGKGRLRSASDANHSLTWTYDKWGRVTVKTQVVAGVTRTVNYGYTSGRLTSMTTPSGQALVYSYNSARQVTGITVNGTVILTNVIYEPFGPVAGWTWGNNSLAVRQYDLDGRITTVDSAGQSSYGYDDAGQIVSRYDDELNSYMLPPRTTNFVTDAASNKLVSTTGVLARTYTFDAAGNTTAYGGLSFAYNNANRMKSATNASVTTQYLYNALGQRVRKSSPSGTVYYVYSEAGQLIGEYGAAGVLIQETIWLGDIPVATVRPKAGGGVDVFYVHTDHLNTPRRVTTPVGNSVVWRWDSDPFGEAPANADPDGDSTQFVFNLRFPGQYADVESGLNYNYFRDYDPAIGRYVESDPIGLAGGINTFAYVSGNPVMLFDLMGLDPLGTLKICLDLENATYTRKEIYTKNRSLKEKRTDYRVVRVGSGATYGRYARGIIAIPTVTFTYQLWLQHQYTTYATEIERSWSEHVLRRLCEWEVTDECGNPRSVFVHNDKVTPGVSRYRTIRQWISEQSGWIDEWMMAEASWGP
ncbi:MAG: RHS repeat protein [Proteobacteria bacterium]|nr:RHS repeat protein [Pseudomonadota bacterium]